VLVGERTLYVPSFALAAGVAGLATLPVFARAGAARTGRVAVAIVMVLFGARVITRIPDWQSTDTVMQALVRDRPDSFRGHWHLARMAREEQDARRAVAHYDTAVSLWPHRRNLLLEAAGYAATNGELGRAAGLVTLAVRQWPDDVDGQRLLAGIALDANDTVRAAEAIRVGLLLAPDDPVLRQMKAALDSITGRSAQ
jgi:predicted Zn-dependent protease